MTDSPPWKEDPKNPTRKSSEKRKDKYGNEIKNVAKHLARKAMNSVKEAAFKNAAVAKKAGAKLKMDPDTGTPDHFTAAQRRKKGLDEAANSVHVKTYDSQGNKQMNSPEFKKHVSAHGGEMDYVSDKGAAFKFKSASNAAMFHRGVQSKFKELDSEHDMNEEADSKKYPREGFPEEGDYGYHPNPGMKPQESDSDEDMDKAYKKATEQEARKPLNAKIVEHDNCGTPECCGQCDAEEVKEELGKSNEWGTDALRKKYAAMTPGQEGLAAKKIPTFDPRYDGVPTRYIGGIQKEETLSEISARGAIARQDFRAKIQKVLSDPKAIAKAKKNVAKKKAAEADVPKNLVHQLHKSQSINAKVKFYDGKEHEIAPNHHDKFMNKYHGLKSSIEKESLVKRAHKSHDEFLKAIHEEWADFSQEKPNTDSITPANYPTPPMHDDMLDYNNDDRHDEYDALAIENDVTTEIENSEWEDLVDYYDYEDLNYEDSDEDIAEGITPQGRLKKRFNMMRNKSRRNMARNLALKRVATPDRIKSRSVRAARNMVYSRVLRGRDRSSLSPSERTRIEGMVKRMAPMVGRLSVRLQQKERMIDRKRINNKNKRKK